VSRSVVPAADAVGPPRGQGRARHDWTIVLAGGEGSRLRSLTTDDAGVSTPKQFCSFGGERSLLGLALERAERVVPRDRILVVVAEEHRTWWEEELAGIPPGNVVAQPGNRGTAAGLLVPLLVLLRRDPEARALVLPSDHYVAREWTLATALVQMLRYVGRTPDRIVLLGLAFEEQEPGLGWIVAGTGSRVEPRPVIDFVEKPDSEELERLAGRGALVNSLILAAHVRFLLTLMSLALPGLVRPFEELLLEGSELTGATALEKVYGSLPTCDISQDFLECLAGGPELYVLQVPSCGWSDLGTPERVRSSRARYLGVTEPESRPSRHTPDLAVECLARSC